MEQKEEKIPFAICKRLLVANGMRAGRDAVESLQVLMVKYANEVSKKATTSATNRKRKTITSEDVENPQLE